VVEFAGRVCAPQEQWPRSVRDGGEKDESLRVKHTQPLPTTTEAKLAKIASLSVSSANNQHLGRTNNNRIQTFSISRSLSQKASTGELWISDARITTQARVPTKTGCVARNTPAFGGRATSTRYRIRTRSMSYTRYSYAIDHVRRPTRKSRVSRVCLEMRPA
jgi:hypothetical protein